MTKRLLLEVEKYIAYSMNSFSSKVFIKVILFVADKRILFLEKEGKNLNPLSPKSDPYLNSPCDINAF